jgi:diguanylate cyclase (GGDEF)-like protein
MTTQEPATKEPTPATTQGDPPLRFWRRASLRRQMIYSFAAPVLIMVLASLFLVRALDKLGLSAQANLESIRSVGMRHELLNSVLDAETGLRGYQLTGDPQFLQPYKSGLLNFQQIAQRLDEAEAHSPADLQRLQQVKALFARWLHAFAEPQILLRQQSPLGEASRLRLLASLIGAPPNVSRSEHLVAYARVVQLLQQDKDAMAPGPHALELANLLARASNATTAADAGVERQQLATALLALADSTDADEARMISSASSLRGKTLIDAIRVVMQASLRQETIEQEAAEAVATGDIEHAIWIALLVPMGALLIGLLLTVLLMVDAIRAIRATSRGAAALAGGDLGKRLKVLRTDEIGELGNAFNRMAEELSDRNRRSVALDHFHTLLVTSNSMEEIHAVVARMCADMFPGTSGAIYRTAPSRNAAERVAQWNWPDGVNGRAFHPDDCRAMRSGKPHFVGDDALDVPCRHTQQLGVALDRCLCLPLAAQGEMLGVLQLCLFTNGGRVIGKASVRDRETAVTISEQLAMSLANMQLREQLRNQSIRDPLTGLFNRRYLEETMARELARTARNGQPLAVIAIDVDHFKKFNDAHGHAAGDKVLVELASVLRGGIRSTDIACRYGGEEFVLLMPESPLPIAIARVEALRRQTRELRVRIGDVQLEPITISSGIAIAPLHGESGDMLLRNADTALYAAKAGGRDRVIVYQAE